jgi:nitrogen fixation/metabolism regulation signal transduction histidine kinase
VIVIVLFGAILASLYLMSAATQDSSRLGEMYSLLLLINSLGSVLLLILVGANVFWLARQLRQRAAGSALTARMIFLFILLTLTPASIVFYFSMLFLQRSIDSWFDVRIDRAMEDALKLGQAAIDERMRALLKQTEHGAKRLEHGTVSEIAMTLDELRETSDEGELTVFSKQGHIIASSGPEPGTMIPDLPDAGTLIQVRNGRPFIELEPGMHGHLQVRALVALADDSSFFLQALYPLPLRISLLSESVESAYLQHKELVYLRGSLTRSFSLTLSLVLLLSLLAAIWVAFISIRRIIAPVRHLAQGTRAVAEGRYEQRLPVKQRDELGFLVESFNAMTQSLSQARDEAHRSRMEVERQRSYLQTVLANLSSGVLSFDVSMHLLTANSAADAILHSGLESAVGSAVTDIQKDFPHLTDLMLVVEERLSSGGGPWNEEISFDGPQGRQDLLCRGTPLFGSDGEPQGAVVVFDDVTALIQAQRQAAWSEVARRLAHEIKNPLTPIQLSAERLKLKLSHHLQEPDASFLDRATRTIVQQVEAMKTMVNAFAEYAKPAIIQLQRLDLYALIEEVVALYPPQAGLTFELKGPKEPTEIIADPVRIRQVLHNLIKNAQEATAHSEVRLVKIIVEAIDEAGMNSAQIRFGDSGPGIPTEQADRIFEPYVTTKAKGTGLGLAIVKKIIEEHGGSIRLESADRPGATFVIRLPLALHGTLIETRTSVGAQHE